MLLIPGTKNNNNFQKVDTNDRIWLLNGSSKQTERRRNRDYYFKPNSLESTKSQDFGLNDSESFHCAISPVLRLAQFFGILPVTGLSSSSTKDLIYKKKSLVFAHSLLIILGAFIVILVKILTTFKILGTDNFDLKVILTTHITLAVFFGNSCLANILFLRLSPHWIALQNEWNAVEKFIDWNKSERPLLRKKFCTLSATLLTVAFVEHSLSTISRYPISMDELFGKSFTAEEYVNITFVQPDTELFSAYSLKVAYGVLLCIISRTSTFSWNFMDLFVILVSTGLAERYKLLNKQTIHASRIITDWHEVRQDYAALTRLVKRVDQLICPIILLSFSNNLYFICLQLFNSLSVSGSVTDILYFFGSFLFLFGRTIAVTLYASRIHDESKIALLSIYKCPSSFYDLEAQRLEHQLATDEVALTGLRFFVINRSFLLAIFGAVATYEIILLQFAITVKQP